MESRAEKLRCPKAAAEGRSGELSRTHAVDRVGSRRSGGTFQFASAAPQALRACVGLPRLKSARHFASLLCLQLHESGLAWTGVGRGKESACRAEWHHVASFLNSRSRSQAKMTGVTTRMWMREESMPPTTGAARGCMTSMPVRVLQKIGSRPAMAVAMVMTFGRRSRLRRPERGNNIAGSKAWILGRGRRE